MLIPPGEGPEGAGKVRAYVCGRVDGASILFLVLVLVAIAPAHPAGAAEPRQRGHQVRIGHRLLHLLHERGVRPRRGGGGEGEKVSSEL